MPCRATFIRRSARDDLGRQTHAVGALPRRMTGMSDMSWADLEPRIADALSGDQGRLRQQLRSIGQLERSGKPFDRSLARFTHDLQSSIARRATRRASVPAITYDNELPIAARRDEIAAAIGAPGGRRLR